MLDRVLRLEDQLTKQRILKNYLNVVEWGDGVFGAEAASQTVLSPAGGIARAVGSGAARRRDHQPAAAEPGASDASGCCGASS